MQSSSMSQRNSIALCLDNPKEAEIECTRKLKEYLTEADAIASQEDMDHRTEVLVQLESLVKSCIQHVTITSKSLSPAVTESVGGKLYTFGSYRLGVINEDTEIDTIYLAPSHVQRSDFFTSLYQILQQERQVSDLRVECDFLVQMKFEGVKINLFFARLPLNEITEVDVQDNSLLAHLDENCAKSFNACRVTEAILQRVPNLESFRLTLLAVRLWAKRHGIYSDYFGYLGGVSSAIMVAKICQLFPNACAATLVEKFFLVYSQWTWPDPVQITDALDFQLGFEVWSPTTFLRHLADLMPVITPCYPSRNATSKVTPVSKDVILEEFGTSAKISEEIMGGRANWKKLFQPPNFFTKYSKYLIVAATARTPQDQIKWRSMMQARIRFLLLNLEDNPLAKKVRLVPGIFSSCFERFIDRPHSCWVIGLEGSADVTINIQTFMQTVCQDALSGGIYQMSMQMHCYFGYRELLPLFLSQEDLESFAPKDGSPQHIQRLERREAVAG